MLKVTHIYHDGFLVEMEESVLIFDWYTGKLPVFDYNKNVYVFVSHKHEDHYGKIIYTLADTCPKLVYVLDKGIRVPHKRIFEADPELDKCAGIRAPHKQFSNTAPEQNVRKSIHVQGGHLSDNMVITVDSGKDYSIKNIKVHTFLSTDIGVAFLVEAEGKLLFHAGDLNIWYWEGEPDKDNRWQIGTFKAEIKKLSDILASKELDIAFLPLDPRLEGHAADGFLYFLSHIPVKEVRPMHYWSNTNKVLEYLMLPQMRKYREKIII